MDHAFSLQLPRSLTPRTEIPPIMKTRNIFFAAASAAAFVWNPLSVNATVSSGDLALIGMGADTDYKRLDFVVLKTIQAGEVIRFTDSGWLSSGSFRGNEGGAVYTFPTIALPGTVVSASGTNGATWGANTNWSSGDDVTVGTNGMNFSTSGDSILVFTGTSAEPNFVFGLSTLPYVATSTSSSNTAIPLGLNLGVNALNKSSGTSDFDNIYYSGTTTFTSAAEALAAIANSENWTGNNTTYSPLSSFVAIPEPSAALLGALGILGVFRRRRR
ncbi:MAG: hypothetical protein RLZZ245_246 [Verrucomicrobiota bacterium]